MYLISATQRSPSELPVSSGATEQVPAQHASGARQSRPQPPQLRLSVKKLSWLASQPLPEAPSQSSHPGAQLAMTQLPSMHLDAALGRLHGLAQAAELLLLMLLPLATLPALLLPLLPLLGAAGAVAGSPTGGSVIVCLSSTCPVAGSSVVRVTVVPAVPPVASPPSSTLLLMVTTTGSAVSSAVVLLPASVPGSMTASTCCMTAGDAAAAAACTRAAQAMCWPRSCVATCTNRCASRSVSSSSAPAMLPAGV